MSWVQQTAHKIAREQQRILDERPIIQIDDDVLGHISYYSHWLKAGKAGKVVAAVEAVANKHGPLRFECDGPDSTGLIWVKFYTPQDLYAALGRNPELAHVFWIERSDTPSSTSNSPTNTISIKTALEKRYGDLLKKTEGTKQDLRSALDTNLERNTEQKKPTKKPSQVAMVQKIKEHLREIDSRSTREVAGSKIIDATTKDKVETVVKPRRGRVRCELRGEDDWMLIGC